LEPWQVQALKIAAGLVLQVWCGSLVLGICLRPFLRQIEQTRTETEASTSRGFADGGKVIGYLERILIYVFVLAGELAAVGFLVAAKSILRFGELKDSEHRMESEYIIIGTLASFAYGIAVATLVKWWI
jgi:hypothetical protein